MSQVGERTFDYKLVAKLYREGMSGIKIARKLGIAPASAYYALDMLKVKRRSRGSPATFSHAQARSLRARGWTLKKIGDKFGVTRERIRQVCLGREG